VSGAVAGGASNERRGAIRSGACLHLRSGEELAGSHTGRVYSDATVKLITATVHERARDPTVGRAEPLRASARPFFAFGSFRFRNIATFQFNYLL